MRELRSERGDLYCHRAAFKREGCGHRAGDRYSVPDADRRTARLDNAEPARDLH